MSENLETDKKQFFLVGQVVSLEGKSAMSITYAERPGEITNEDLYKLRCIMRGTYRMLQTDHFRRHAFNIGKSLD